jgi:hypothetical protein
VGGDQRRLLRLDEAAPQAVPDVGRERVDRPLVPVQGDGEPAAVVQPEPPVEGLAQGCGALLAVGRAGVVSRRPPSAIRAAAFASGVAVALETNGTVRDARGLASST